MLPASPSKKAYPDDLWSGTGAFNTYPDRIVPEDLTIALQNLGSRVRKSVTEGYNTHHLTTFTVPATPCSTPAKFPSAQTTTTPIFRSANDSFNSVFPPGSLRVPLTPSPKKRQRPEEPSDRESRQIRGSDVEMGTESEADDDQVMVILRPDANSLPRKIKPLRRNVAQNSAGAGAVIPNPFTLISYDG